jgi:polysaccharide biosynthesis transport protein
MIALKSQLARAQAMGGGGARMTPGSSTPNPMFVTLRSMQAEKAATASALASRKAQLEGEINRILALQASNPDFTAEQTAIDRDYTALKTQYDKLVADREDIRLRGQVQTQTDAVRFNVIDPPSKPTVPAAPNRPLLLTAVLLAALGGGVGAAFAFGQLKTTYPTATRLEKASGLPVIGSITEVVRAPERQLRRKRRMQFAGGVGALVGLWIVLMVTEFVQRGMVA